MQDFEGRVALITGGASGIGLALARRLAGAGMKLALADVEAAALETVAKELEAAGTELLAVTTDVGDAAQMDRLGEKVRDRFGGVDLLCLNAGVSGGGGPIEQLSTEDWAWALNVNLWGVIHGLLKAVGEIFACGAAPAHVADCVFDAVSANRFWIYTDEVHRDAIAARHRALEAGEQPPTEFGALDGY